jgi:hypothetical protein
MSFPAKGHFLHSRLALTTSITVVAVCCVIIVGGMGKEE